MTTNPFAATSQLTDQAGIYGDHARRIRGGFLYRVIELDHPFSVRLVYDGWWFRQKVTFGGELVWFRISWLTIHRRVTFRVPSQFDAARRPAAIEIDFSPGLTIRRFRVWIDEQIVYDEIH
jgi:hypothetical protein